MSAQVRIVRREQRLIIARVYTHQVTQFTGPLEQFIAYLLKDRLTGVATIRLNQGLPYGLEFDAREEIPIDKKTE